MTRGENVSIVSSYPEKKAGHPGTAGKKDLNMEVQHRYRFLFAFENIKFFEYRQRWV